MDTALALNRRAERIVIGLSVTIFALGAATLVVAYFQQNPYVAGGGTLLNGFLYWPIRSVLGIRRDNLTLQTLPEMIAVLPPAEAAEELKKLIQRVREGK